jgi:uncharacterized protein involved in type VI secretion and phage assembly
MLDLLSNQTDSAARPDRIYGVVIGVVTNNRDPDNLGRVKVRFPWLTESDESSWARLATPMAGSDRGLFLLPEVDDEVLVAFEHGDVRFPYVLGALWNGVDTPPRTNANGENNLRVMRSRRGHELIFDDSQNGAQVTIHTSAGHQIILDDTAGQEKILIQDRTSNNTITVDAVRNTITIAAQMQLSLQAPTITIEADTMLTIKAGATLTLQGTLVKIN